MKQFKSIEIFRGLAAMLVVIYHLSRLYQQNYGYFPLTSITEMGHIGVDFFFVLSGFIIYYVHSNELGLRDELKSYFIKRFSRIYPFFWFVILLNLMLIPFVSSKEMPTVYDLLMNLSLLPYKEYFVIGVSWTLQHEVLFYLLFAFLFLNKKLGKVILGIWAVLIISSLFQKNLYFHVLSSSYNLQFFIGIGIAVLLNKNRMPRIKLLFPISISLLLILVLLELSEILPRNGFYTRMFYGSTFAILIASGINSELAASRAFPLILVRLGSASYAVYLLHLFFGGILFKIFEISGVHEILNLSIAALLLIILTVYLSYIVSLTVELPLSRSVRKFLISSERKFFQTKSN